MTSDINRRRFVSSAVASGVFTIVPRHVLGGTGHVAPSEKITLAHIGMGTQGFRELGSVLAQPEIQIVAVCDPNAHRPYPAIPTRILRSENGCQLFDTFGSVWVFSKPAMALPLASFGG